MVQQKKLTDVNFRVSIEIFDERNSQNFGRVKKVIPAFTTVRKPDMAWVPFTFKTWKFVKLFVFLQTG